MILTVTQAQLFASHLAALRQSLTDTNPPEGAEKFCPCDVIGSAIYELGPFVTPSLADSVVGTNLSADFIPAEKLELICESIDKAEDALLSALEEGDPPGDNFKVIIAQLLEQLGPFLIQALIGFLLKPEPKTRAAFSRNG